MDCAPEISKHYSRSISRLASDSTPCGAAVGCRQTFPGIRVGSCQPYGGLCSSTSSLHAKAAQAPICNRLHPENSFGLDLAGLHRMLAVMRRRPKFVFGQDIDKDWREWYTMHLPWSDSVFIRLPSRLMHRLQSVLPCCLCVLQGR